MKHTFCGCEKLIFFSIFDNAENNDIYFTFFITSRSICHSIYKPELQDCDVQSCISQKNNGVKLNGVRICKEGSAIAPVFYMDGYYEQGYGE